MIYFLRPVGHTGPVKIGLTTLQPEQRLHHIAPFSPLPLELISSTEGDLETERRIHTLLAASHYHHEWFHWSPTLDKLLREIATGIFDASTLPAPRPRPDMDRKAIAARTRAAAERTRQQRRFLATEPIAALSAAASLGIDAIKLKPDARGRNRLRPAEVRHLIKAMAHG